MQLHLCLHSCTATHVFVCARPDPSSLRRSYALGSYSFDTYKGTSKPKPSSPEIKFAAVVWPEGADKAYVRSTSCCIDHAAADDDGNAMMSVHN